MTIFDDQLLERVDRSVYVSRLKIFGALVAVLGLFGLAGCPNEARNESSTQLNAGNKALGQNQYETAIAAFEKAVEKNRDNHLAWYGMGAAYLKKAEPQPNKEDYTKAVDALEKAVQEAPEQPMYQMMYGIALFDKEVATAKEDQARKQNKKPEEVDPDLSGLNFEKAAQHLGEAIKLVPDLWRAHYFLGKIYRAQDKAKQAADEFTTAIKANPREHGPYVALSELYLKWDYNDQAIQVASAGTANVVGSTDKSDIFYDLGLAYDEKKMYDKAIEAYTSAIESKKDNHKAKFQRGQAYFRKGDFTNAKKDLEDFSKTGGASLEFDKQMASKDLMDIAKASADAAPKPPDQKQSPEDLVKKKGGGGPPPKKGKK